MRIRSLPLLALSTLALIPSAPAMAQDAFGVSACGIVRAFTAATATTDGSVTIGSRTFALEADALYSAMGQNREVISVGRAICLQGTAASGAFSQYTAIPMPDPYCGTAMAFTAPTPAAAGSLALRDVGIAMLPVPAGTDIGAVTLGRHLCVVLALTGGGDAVAERRWLTLADRSTASVNHCGRVSQWTEPQRLSPTSTPVHQVAGSITVGTRVFTIAAGTTYSLVSALPKMGEPTCLSGWLDSTGQLIQYAAQPWLYSPMCGAIAEYVVPTSDRDGVLRFALRGGEIPPTTDSYRFRVPAGASMPPDVASGAHCFTIGLDATGVAIITGLPVRSAVAHCGTVDDAFLEDLIAGGFLIVSGKKFVLGTLDSRVTLPPIDRVVPGAQVCVRGEAEPRGDALFLRTGEVTLGTALVTDLVAIAPVASPSLHPAESGNVSTAAAARPAVLGPAAEATSMEARSDAEPATRTAFAGAASLPVGLLAVAAVGLMLRRVRGLRRTD